jgi:hypothetical protein
VSLLANGSADALGGVFRGYLVRNVPTTLYEASPGWGKTAPTVNGIKWTGRLLLRPHGQYAEKNDGDWRRVRFEAANLDNSLILDLRKVRKEEPGRITFDLFVAFDARVEYEHQKWVAGVRLYSGSISARLRARALVTCEVTTNLEKNGGLLPDAVFRLRATQATLGYDNLVIDHVYGVGGEAAKMIGESFKGALKQLHPSLEGDLLERANKAIIKVGDTKEVRVNLANLFKAKENGSSKQPGVRK